MERLDGGAPVPAPFRGGIVALGNFDGMHRGHAAVIGRAVARARDEGRRALVVTFEPHPVRHFRPGAPPFRLTTPDQKARAIAATGADALVVFGFDAALAATAAEAFVDDLLIGRLGAAAVVTGEDFTFGTAKRGTTAMLAAHPGLSAEAVPAVRDDGDAVISSTRIRDALRAGDPQVAARLLGRPFSIEATVTHGDKRGRTIGYPTANSPLGDYLRPAYGIYAVVARLPDGSRRAGVANLGIRPSFTPPVELLETHVFDWSGDLYGRLLAVELHHFLRPEARFDRLDPLIAQMDADSAQARRLLAGGADLG